MFAQENMMDEMPDRAIDGDMRAARCYTQRRHGWGAESLLFILHLCKRAYDQVVHDVVTETAGYLLSRQGRGWGDDGPHHHGVYDIVYFDVFPIWSSVRR